MAPLMSRPAASLGVARSTGVQLAPRTTLAAPPPKKRPRLRQAALAPVRSRPLFQRCSAQAAAAAAQAMPQPQQQQATNPIAAVCNAWVNWWTLESPRGAEPEARTPIGPLAKKLISLCSKDTWLLIGASVFMIIAALCELAIPHFATKSIFAAAEGTSSAAFADYLQLLVVVVAVYGVFAALRGFCFSILNNRMTRRLRTELFANLTQRETSFFDSQDVGQLTSRLQADCQAVTKCVATNLNIALRNMLQAIGGVVYLYMLSPSLCGVTLGISFVLWAVTLIYGDFARKAQKVFQDVLAESNTVAEEVMSLSRVVRTFGTEKQEERRYVTWLDRLYEVGKRQAAGYGLFIMAGHIACYASKVAALVFGCAMVLQGTLTAEQLTNFIFYVEFVTYASLNVCDEYTELMEAVGASERVINLLDAPAAPQLATGDKLPNFTGRVEVQDVVFSYPTRPFARALDGVTLSLEPGKLTALVGLSGSGKTTLVALLQRLYDADSGSILLDGVLDLRKADADWYRTQIGVVSQEPRLFGTSIAANIAYGMEHDLPSRAQIEAAALAANAHAFIMALPQGYDTPVTEKLLSGGQKQRIALARALIRKPKLLILDEATSALDAESESQVQAALDRAMATRDRTVIVIAHRLSTVRNADCIVVMDKGKVHEMGSHHELLLQKGIYWELVCRQQYGIDPKAQEAVTRHMQLGSSSGTDGNSRDGNLSDADAIGPLAREALELQAKLERQAQEELLIASLLASNGNGNGNGNGGGKKLMSTSMRSSTLASLESMEDADGVPDEGGRPAGSSILMTQPQSVLAAVVLQGVPPAEQPAQVAAQQADQN